VRFWDSSALVPLIVSEPSSPALEAFLSEDPHVAAWWASHVECASALARRAQELPVDAARDTAAFRRLDELAGGWTEVPPTEQLRSVAVRLVRTHPLRAGDALQLAAAITASENRPDTLDLVTLDDRLALAASREGFRVVGV
jgi:predicted nucleic acid-binding protein